MRPTIEHIAPGDLRPWARNARTHSKKQLKQIAASISRFGFNNPVLISDDNEIIAGHGRVEAAKQLGWKTVPTIVLSHLTVMTASLTLSPRYASAVSFILVSTNAEICAGE